jgi:hypothetical protein
MRNNLRKVKRTDEKGVVHQKQDVTRVLEKVDQILFKAFFADKSYLRIIVRQLLIEAFVKSVGSFVQDVHFNILSVLTVQGKRT